MTVIDPQLLREQGEPQAQLFDLHAERAVLGAILNRGECIVNAGPMQPSDWWEPKHTLIWRAIQEAHAQRGVVDPIAVKEALQRRVRLDEAGGYDYLLDLLEQASPVDADPGILKSHADIVRDYGRRRRAAETCANVAVRIRAGDSVDDVLPMLRAVLEPRETTETTRTMSWLDTAEMPMVDWIIDGILPQKVVALIGGAPASGKSLVVIDWCCRMATGQQWRGRDLEPGSCLYMAGEGHGGVGGRIRAWLSAHPAAKPIHPFEIDDGVPDLSTAAGIAKLRQRIETFARKHGAPPAMIVVDTLSQAFGAGDENDAATVSPVLAALSQIRKDYGCALLLVHHLVKPERGNPFPKLTLASIRGSGAFGANLDVVLGVEQRADDVRALVTLKQKDAAEAPPVPSRILAVETGRVDRKGRPERCPILVPVEAQAAAAPVDDGMQKIQAAVRQLNGTPTTRDTVVTTARVNLVVGRALLDQAIAEGRVATRPAPGRRTFFAEVSDVQGFAVPPTVPPKGGDGGTATATDKPYAVRDGRDGEGRRDGEDASGDRFQEPTGTTAAPEPPAPTRVVQSEDHGRPEKPSGGRRRRKGAA